MLGVKTIPQMKVECPCGLDDGNGFGCILQALHDQSLKGLGLCSHKIIRE